MTNMTSHIYETFINATAETIWQALTTAEFTSQYWHATHVQSDWEPGSAVLFSYTDGTKVVEGEVLKVEPYTELVYTWHVLYNEAMQAERPSRVCFQIEELGNVCRLRVIHDDFDAGSKVLEQVQGGWSLILCSLKTLLETGTALPMPDAA